MRYEGSHFKRFARTMRMDAFREPPLLSQLYHENSKLAPLGARSLRSHIALFNRSPELKALVRSPRKIHSLAAIVDLARPAPRDALERAVVERRSARAFSGEAVTRDELARLLYFAYGVTDPRTGFRAVPSGGALYALELYAVAVRVDGLEAGVYHYDPPPHRLDVVAPGDAEAELRRCLLLDERELSGAALAIVVTAIFRRSAMKYRERAYRMTLFEAGEVAQNLSLVATALGLGSCLLGGFLDDQLSRLVGADGLEEAALVPMVLGRRRAAARPGTTEEAGDDSTATADG